MDSLARKVLLADGQLSYREEPTSGAVSAGPTITAVASRAPSPPIATVAGECRIGERRVGERAGRRAPEGPPKPPGFPSPPLPPAPPIALIASERRAADRQVAAGIDRAEASAVAAVTPRRRSPHRRPPPPTRTHREVEFTISPYSFISGIPSLLVDHAAGAATEAAVIGDHPAPDVAERPPPDGLFVLEGVTAERERGRRSK